MTSSPRKPVRVTVTISLDVNPELWNLEYGEGDSAAEVRASVKSYIAGQVINASHAEGGGDTWTNIDWR